MTLITTLHFITLLIVSCEFSLQEGRGFFFSPTTVSSEISTVPGTFQVVFSIINVKHQSLNMATYWLILLV